MTTPYQSNMEYSRSLQEKYEYYLIALNFTILALSVQTAKFLEGSAQTLLELGGWVILLIAGVVGLIRLEMQPVAHKGYAQLQRKKDTLYRLKQGKQSGSKDVIFIDEDNSYQSIDEVIERLQQTIDSNEPKISAIESRIVAQYYWHKSLFVVGLVLIMASRAYSPVIDLFAST